jgi:hypothetical protein
MISPLFLFFMIAVLLTVVAVTVIYFAPSSAAALPPVGDSWYTSGATDELVGLVSSGPFSLWGTCTDPGDGDGPRAWTVVTTSEAEGSWVDDYFAGQTLLLPGTQTRLGELASSQRYNGSTDGYSAVLGTQTAITAFVSAGMNVAAATEDKPCIYAGFLRAAGRDIADNQSWFTVTAPNTDTVLLQDDVFTLSGHCQSSGSEANTDLTSNGLISYYNDWATGQYSQTLPQGTTAQIGYDATGSEPYFIGPSDGSEAAIDAPTDNAFYSFVSTGINVGPTTADKPCVFTGYIRRADTADDQANINVSWSVTAAYGTTAAVLTLEGMDTTLSGVCGTTAHVQLNTNGNAGTIWYESYEQGSSVLAPGTPQTMGYPATSGQWAGPFDGNIKLVSTLSHTQIFSSVGNQLAEEGKCVFTGYAQPVAFS